ncbi:MAG TPA: hypothetical protein VL947_06555, partial [Cytophagales bacterium]|nr:hypothetical protein [Cytophagales bacterium]
LMLMLSVGVMAQQQTFEFFKWGAVSNPLPNWRDRGQNVNDPYKTDSQGRTWSVSSDQSVISWYNNKDTNKINVPVSPNRKKAYANYNSIRPQVDENNTKIVSLYASRYVVNKYYYDWYFAKTNEAGQTQYVHPTDLGVTDSSSYISNYACIGGKLLINLSNNKYIWQGDLAANLPSMSGMLFSDRKNTIFLIYPGSSYGIYSLHADGSYHKRLGTATVKNYSFDVTTGDLTIVTYENQIYKLNGNTEQLVTIPSSTQLLKTNVQVWPLSLRKATQQAQVVLTEKGFNVQEDGRNNTFLFSQLSTLGLDSLELGSYDHLDCAKLQKDSSIALVYRKSNGSYVQQYYVFAYKKGVVALKAKLDVTSLNLSTKSEFVNILSAGHSYFYLKNSSNINNIIQYKDEKATLIPYRSPNCSLYIMDWAIDEDYLWLSNEASETSPCAVARMRHDDYFVEGRVYYDMNANGIREITELPYNMLKLAVEPSGLLVFPDQQGNFAFKGLAGSAYSVKVLDSVRFVSVKADNKGNIGVKLLEEIPEVKAFFLLPRARCFTNRPANVTLQNVGVVPAEKVVVRLSADNMELLQDSILVDTAIFTYYSIAAGQTLHTTYNIQWPEASQVGQTATLRTVTEMYLGGVLAAVKHDSVQTVIRCSYDPNDKTVTPVGVGNESFTLKEDVLKYLIRFENTGNDTAYHIVIKDTLSNHLI